MLQCRWVSTKRIFHVRCVYFDLCACCNTVTASGCFFSFGKPHIYCLWIQFVFDLSHIWFEWCIRQFKVKCKYRLRKNNSTAGSCSLIVLYILYIYIYISLYWHIFFTILHFHLIKYFQWREIYYVLQELPESLDMHPLSSFIYRTNHRNVNYSHKPLPINVKYRLSLYTHSCKERLCFYLSQRWGRRGVTEINAIRVWNGNMTVEDVTALHLSCPLRESVTFGRQDDNFLHVRHL